MTPSLKLPRVELVDALRGFAVIAILLIHSVEHFIFPVYPDPSVQPDWLNVLDQGVFTVIFSLFAGKAYAIFALLFGFTFFVQYENQRLRGGDFGLRFLWRLLLLTLFATLNAAFFPGGDVLLLFVAVGWVLVVVRRWGNRAVLALALFFLFQPVEWFHYLAWCFDPSYTLPDLGVGPMYGQIAEVTKSGDFGAFLTTNMGLGQKASLLWAVGAGRWIQTAGLFLLGLLLGRTGRFVDSEGNSRFWVRVLIASAVLFGPLYALKVEVLDNLSAGVPKQTVGVILDMWQKLAFTGVLVASFVLLYRRAGFRRLTANLRFYGRMSLSNYVGQSIIGSVIYFPFALHLAPYCGYAASLAVGVAIFCGQLAFCKWWLGGHRQGPLEALWHRLTWIGAKK